MHVLLAEISPADQRNARLTTGLGYIAAYVRQNLPQIDVRIVKGDPAWIERAALEYRPDIVGISTVSQYYRLAAQAADVCHRHAALVVMGGHHVSALPSSMTQSMDLAVIGEGEDTMLEICRTFLEKGADRSAYDTIAGVATRDESGRFTFADPRPLHKPLDDFPFPARDLMHIRRGESIGIITSRGCSYRCAFCASSAFWKSIRFHSPEYVTAEIKEVVERYRTPHIYFWDDLFVADLKRIEAIATLLLREPLLKGIKYSATCRANLASDQLARLLKAMNVVEVMFGLESLSPDTLRYLKPHVTVEQNRNAVDIFHRHGINVTGFFVLGSPRETRAEIELTLDFARKAPLYRVEAYLLTPLPGTQVWDYALRRGLIDPNNVPWERLYIDNPADTENGIHLSETMDAEELRNYWRQFHRIRRAKDFANLVRRLPQHIRHLLRSPRDELTLVAERLRTRRQGHI